MVNYKSTFLSLAWFFGGVMSLVLFERIIDPLLDVIGNMGGLGVTIATLGEMISVIGSVFMVLIVPLFIGINGINETNEFSNSQNVIIAIMIMLFGLLISVSGWFMIESVPEFLETTFFIGLYWVGFFLVWLLNIVAMPINVFLSYR